MKKFLIYLFVLFSFHSFAQIKGIVKDVNGNPLPFVNIYIENTYLGTTSNELGVYELAYNEKKSSTLIFQYLGFKTQKQIVNPVHFPVLLDVVLQEESYELKAVEVSNKENPALEIIRKAIAAKQKNSDKTDKFEADFYSRGIFRVKDIPKKFMGIDVGDFDGNLDSTRSGIIYQSETVSKIKFQKPNQLKEEIIASKVAGDDNGFSYNTALNTNYDFYENYVDFGFNMVSPIANNAFNYYKFKLESTFYDTNNQLINKILVTPKRNNEPVFEGYIFIVEDSWAIYGVDLDIKGYRMQQPIVENMKIIQNFSYNKNTKIWAKNSQSLDFIAGIFGMKFTGKFTHVFTNYVFKNDFELKTFGKELVTFRENANKKDAEFWSVSRPVPLTDEELNNYTKKDSIQKIRSSQTYLDSIDAKTNKFKILKIITGYTYKNSYNKWDFNYQGLANLGSLNFNTVQGWNLDSGFSYKKYNETKGKYTSIVSTFNYGFSEDRLRVTTRFYHKFNNTNDAYFSISGGSTISQFNDNEPISAFVNTISTLFFKDNYMKLYNKEFAKLAFGREVTNGIFLNTSLSYENRRGLLNNTDYTTIKNDNLYTSNNPLQPYDFQSFAFQKNNIFKANINAQFKFGQKYITRPDGKLNIQNDKYPVLKLFYEKAFASSEKNYEYDFLSALLSFEKTIGNKGDFKLQLKAGQFFNGDNIAFVDYKHFNGNQTHVSVFSNRLNSFSLLPYYSHSTNDAFFELHTEHNFKGFILNKIPLINKLQFNLIAGFHQLNVPNSNPYQEFTIGLDNIGWKKFRFLRVDYVRSYQNGYQGDGFLFGLKF